MEQGGKKLAKTALYFQTKMQLMENITHIIMSLFITTMHSLNYGAGGKSKKWAVKADMQEKRLLRKVNQNFRTAESASSSKSVPGDNSIRDPTQKKRS